MKIKELREVLANKRSCTVDAFGMIDMQGKRVSMVQISAKALEKMLDVIEAAKNQIKLQKPNTVPSLIRALAALEEETP